MKILGTGLSRTGTKSLNEALKVLGFKSIHWSPERFRDLFLGENNDPDFKIFDDVEAVTDIPAALFYREIKSAYPDCKLILTVRDVESWFRSVKYHYEVNVKKNIIDKIELKEAKEMQKFVYGSDIINEFLYKKRFLDHNYFVIKENPDALVLDFTKGDGWEKLCDYLEVPVPTVPFPFENKNKNHLIL